MAIANWQYQFNDDVSDPAGDRTHILPIYKLPLYAIARVRCSSACLISVNQVPMRREDYGNIWPSYVRSQSISYVMYVICNMMINDKHNMKVG